jgi:hypothetical protein
MLDEDCTELEDSALTLDEDCTELEDPALTLDEDITELDDLFSAEDNSASLDAKGRFPVTEPPIPLHDDTYISVKRLYSLDDNFSS